MRGKNAKLCRRLAEQSINANNVPKETRYTISAHTNSIVLDLCLRQTYKYMKRSLKTGRFTTIEMKQALDN